MSGTENAGSGASAAAAAAAISAATNFVSDKVTAPLEKIVITAWIVAGVFFILFVLMVIAAFPYQNGFTRIMVIISSLLFLAISIVAGLFAIYANSIKTKVNEGISVAARSAVSGLGIAKLLNGLVGRRTVDEKTGNPLSEDEARTQDETARKMPASGVAPPAIKLV